MAERTLRLAKTEPACRSHTSSFDRSEKLNAKRWWPDLPKIVSLLIRSFSRREKGAPKGALQFQTKAQLKDDADAHLHRSGGVSLLREQPELRRRACNGEGWIQQLVVVQNVVDTEGGLSTESFGDS